MNKDIIIYTTEKELLHKKDLLEEDKSTNGTYYWTFKHLPKKWDLNVKELIKLYFATKGFVRGYFEIINIDYDEILNEEFYFVDFKSSSWKDIKKIPIKHFQGFKYADSIKELN